MSFLFKDFFNRTRLL